MQRQLAKALGTHRAWPHGGTQRGEPGLLTRPQSICRHLCTISISWPLKGTQNPHRLRKSTGEDAPKPEENRWGGNTQQLPLYGTVKLRGKLSWQFTCEEGVKLTGNLMNENILRRLLTHHRLTAALSLHLPRTTRSAFRTRDSPRQLPSVPSTASLSRAVKRSPLEKAPGRRAHPSTQPESIGRHHRCEPQPLSSPGKG